MSKKLIIATHRMRVRTIKDQFIDIWIEFWNDGQVTWRRAFGEDVQSDPE